MKKQTVYIRVYKKTVIQEQTIVRIKDISDITASPQFKNHIEGLQVFKIPKSSEKGKYLVTLIDIIRVILSVYPDINIQNVGDPEVLIQYQPKAPKENSFIEWIKVIGVSMVIFFGAMVAIMAYTKDTSLDRTFTVLNKILTGEEVKNPLWITIPYSIGIAVGIITFFNHVGKKKLTDDPSPMQIEIYEYEENVENSEIDSIITQKRGQP